MEVIWASNQSLLHWGSGSMNEIHYHFCALSKFYFTLARSNSSCPLFPVDYDCTFGIKNVIIFHQTQKTFFWYTKWVLISMWGGPARSSVANSGYLKVEKGGNNKLSNLKDAIFKTLIMFRFISHSQTSQVENTVMEKPKPIRKSEKFFKKKGYHSSQTTLWEKSC